MDGSLTLPTLHAHYRKIIEPGTGQIRIVSFGTEVKGRDYEMHFLEHSDDGTLLHKRRLYLPGLVPNIFHDMAVTENYYVLYRNPMKLDYSRFLFQLPLG